MNSFMWPYHWLLLVQPRGVILSSTSSNRLELLDKIKFPQTDPSWLVVKKANRMTYQYLRLYEFPPQNAYKITELKKISEINLS